MEQQTPELFTTPPRPQFPERRRPHWREFRRAYPGILTTMGFALVVLIALDVWLVRKRGRYVDEDARLRESMSALQRQQADAILSNEQNKVRMMIELVRRQAQIDKQLHLAVPVDSGVMYLEQEGALLREMPVQVGPERRVGTPPDTVYMVAPRGTRTVERILGASDAGEVPAWVYTDRKLALPARQSRAERGARTSRGGSRGRHGDLFLADSWPAQRFDVRPSWKHSHARRRLTGDCGESQSRNDGLLLLMPNGEHTRWA